MKRFFDALDKTTTKSLTMTSEESRKRKQLEKSIEKLQKQMKVLSAQLEEITETTENIKEQEQHVDREEMVERLASMVVLVGDRWASNCELQELINSPEPTLYDTVRRYVWLSLQKVYFTSL